MEHNGITLEIMDSQLCVAELYVISNWSFGDEKLHSKSRGKCGISLVRSQVSPEPPNSSCNENPVIRLRSDKSPITMLVACK